MSSAGIKSAAAPASTPIGNRRELASLVVLQGVLLAAGQSFDPSALMNSAPPPMNATPEATPNPIRTP
jgi:hypothetical protein